MRHALAEEGLATLLAVLVSCPGCDAATPAVYNAYRNRQVCPECGLPPQAADAVLAARRRAIAAPVEARPPGLSDPTLRRRRDNRGGGTVSSFPADPLNIELTVRSRSAAWLLMRRQPQAWWASADVIGPCEESVRHVGDVSMWTVTHDSWESIHPELVDTVLTADGQQFEPELDEFIGRGPRNVLLVERWTWSTPWRTMAGPLLAATIARFAWQVRLAVCHATSDDDARSSRDLRAAAGAVLEQHGWHPWRGLHIADPRSDAIADTALEILEAWMPTPTPD